jgi:transcriptional regulator of nitric oxide reductase
VLLTAVAGATDHEITESVPEECERKFEELFVGLNVNPPDLTDYLLTFSRFARVVAGNGLDVGEIAVFVK